MSNSSDGEFDFGDYPWDEADPGDVDFDSDSLHSEDLDDSSDSDAITQKKKRDKSTPLTTVSATEELDNARRLRQQKLERISLVQARVALAKALVLVNKLPKPGSASYQTLHSLGIHEEKTKCSKQLKDEWKRAMNLSLDLSASLLETQSSFAQLSAQEPVNTIQHPPQSSQQQLNQDIAQALSTIDRTRKWVLATADEWNTRAELARSLSSRHRMTSSSVLPSLNEGISSQVTHTMNDKERILQLIHRRRSSEPVIGETTIPDTKFDLFIVDDTDFYQRLLQRLSKETSGATSSVLSTKEIENAEESLKATLKLQHRIQQSGIDRRASKGRAINYTVHPRLVGFMAKEAKEWPHNTEAVMSSLFSIL
ncbi:putative protein AATF/BFR2 [Blattamonas nauphoetae]|uniref:Apoptosis-antagonizing transcription factor C-terminal domain-containing protein n=1 Tax=Blattamonas nauphoetae TaxID=2049346 RepID=A0ABQ9WUR0_9EUKA|nr:putative protein AATF/BFR2 [Blattamonas nauphoetae]